MDTTLFIPLIDALMNIVGAIDAKWTAIAALALLLLRAGVLKFPVSLPFLKPKAKDAPKDEPKDESQDAPKDDKPGPVGPKDADPMDAFKDLLDVIAQRVRDRLRNRFNAVVEDELKRFPSPHEIPLAEEIRHSE